MQTISLSIPEPVLSEFLEFAARSQRDPTEVMREALERYRDEKIRPTQQLEQGSILDHVPVNVGRILKPWNSRAEMLEDFFDRD